MVLKKPTIQTHTRMCVCDEIASWRRLEHYAVEYRWMQLLFIIALCWFSFVSNLFFFAVIMVVVIEAEMFSNKLFYMLIHSNSGRKKRRALNITEKHQDIMYRNYHCSDIAVVRWIVILVCVSVSAFWWFFHPWILFFFMC